MTGDSNIKPEQDLALTKQAELIHRELDKFLEMTIEAEGTTQADTVKDASRWLHLWEQKIFSVKADAPENTNVSSENKGA